MLFHLERDNQHLAMITSETSKSSPATPRSARPSATLKPT